MRDSNVIRAIRDTMRSINSYYTDGAHQYAYTIPCRIKGYKTAIEYLYGMEDEIERLARIRDVHALNELLPIYKDTWLIN